MKSREIEKMPQKEAEKFKELKLELKEFRESQEWKDGQKKKQEPDWIHRK